MKEFLKYYKNPDEEKLNMDLIERQNVDDDLIQYIVEACKSLEVSENIKFLGYTYKDDESEIDLESYVTTRSTSSAEQKQKYIYINDNRTGEITLHFDVHAYDKKTDKVISKEINKKLLIPVPDKNNYYTMKGKKFFLLYQLVDSATYNTRDAVVLKSFLPIFIGRQTQELTDLVSGETFVGQSYTINMFKKNRDLLLFYFAKFGFKKTLEYFSMGDIARVVTEIPHEDEERKNKNFYFKMNNVALLEVDKKFFKKFKYVRTMTLMINNVIHNKFKLEDLENKNAYIEIIGLGQSSNKNVNALDKGTITARFFERMVDYTTKKILRIDYRNKKDIYALCRWLIQNYDSIRTKDNLDLTNKRLRYNEFVGILFTTLLSQRFNRLLSQGKRLTMDNIKELFAFPGNKLLTELYRSGLLIYEDKINALDVVSKLRYSLKGQNSLGNKNSRNITKNFRTNHPSHLGRIDLSCKGNSDPGTSGVLSPFVKMDKLYFSDKREPEKFLPIFEADLVKFIEEENLYEVVVTDNLGVEDYYDNMQIHLDNISSCGFMERERSVTDNGKDN